ncbi:bile acid:sodium symporter family protein [Pedosphaera parvula]|uniref:Bile acid:sodium symporter n=1 Tax=Pedosphaera parvula (strain Ellin514) TaxID=320771 RepID=B9XK79_PEDPL|nr:bile acid:sodium symporter family protein [Pedosphaera parvula]EEF59717.1 Bile acid:sodium symporter [Pedosphaera parvula Ellin514]
MKFKPDWFLIGMAFAVLLAWLFPDPGAHGGILHPELLTKLGVALIFFWHGVALSFSALKAGTLRWPVHLVVQATTFLFFPVIGLLLLWPLKGWLSPDLRLGFFFLCALPSTVSSSVALTAAARGNVPVAVFNATLSSLIGVFLTPLWIGLELKTSGNTLPLGNVILDLVLWLVLPLIAGQLTRPLLGDWAARHKKFINRLDRGTILLLVYTSFCDSMKWHVWSGHAKSTLLVILVGSVLLFFIVMWTVNLVCNALHFPTEDRIAAVFCGSKKTLASGVPMARLIFAGHPAIGLILLPIMIYHPLQLIICSALANRWARRTLKPAPRTTT